MDQADVLSSPPSKRDAHYRPCARRAIDLTQIPRSDVRAAHASRKLTAVNFLEANRSSERPCLRAVPSSGFTSFRVFAISRIIASVPSRKPPHTKGARPCSAVRSASTSFANIGTRSSGSQRLLEHSLSRTRRGSFAIGRRARSRRTLATCGAARLEPHQPDRRLSLDPSRQPGRRLPLPQYP